MKAAATMLRRLADWMDPPPLPTMVERKEAATSAFEQSLARAAEQSADLCRTATTMGEVGQSPRWGNNSRACFITLTRKGFSVKVKNNGLHLQFFGPGQPPVSPAPQLVDFWTTTGKWWIAARKKRGQGLQALLRELGAS